MMKLLLADDHTLFRDTLVQYIQRAQPQAEITLAKDFHETMDKMKENPDQDLVLLDLRMPGMEGMEGFRKIRQEYPHVKVALMSGVAEPEDVEMAMEIGALGYFPKTLSGKALLGAIQVVLAGEKYIPIDHGSSNIMPSYYSGQPREANSNDRTHIRNLPDVNLTPREKEVLSFLLKGAANKEIANELDLQVVTVKLHVRGICRKLGATNRTQAALIAREMNFQSA